jgi:hypothetical protein
MGLRRKGSTVPRKVYLDPVLAGKIDLLLVDPIRQKPQYAAFSVLVEELLRRYIEDLESLPSQASTENFK